MKLSYNRLGRYAARIGLSLLCWAGAIAPALAQATYPAPPPPATNITRVEYFFDTDPGFGLGTPISVTPGTDLSSLSISPSLAALSDGIHSLNVRGKSSFGWSQTNTRMFFKQAIAVATLPNIKRVEYFVDTDPGFGLATALPITPGTDLDNLSLALDLSTLSPGFHRLNIRAKSDAGWSHVNGRTFFIQELPSVTLANITRVEYFLDTDPGFGLATPLTITQSPDLSNVTLPLDLTSVTPGFHRLQVRAKDANGHWSLVNGRTFFVQEVPASAMANIEELEYFFDTDPGFGSGIAIPFTPGPDLNNIPLALDLSALSPGFHKLQVRAKDANDNWSLTDTRTFFIQELPAATLANITRVEYFLDADPGFGQATQLPITPGTDLNTLSIALDLSSVTPGFHHLQVRAKDNNGLWSLTHDRTFFLQEISAAALPNVDRVEYFVDTDPGFGNGTQVTVTPGTDLTNVTFAVDVTGLSLGAHKLYTRAQDEDGNWTLTNVRTFDVITPVPFTTLTTDAIAGTTFCAGEQVLVSFSTNGGAANSSNVFTAQLSDASGNFGAAAIIGTFAGVSSATINATIPPGTPSGSGYRIRVISSDPAITGSDNGSNLTIGAPPTIAYAGQNQIVCGTTTSLTANTPTSGTGSWSLVSGSGIIASPNNPITAISNLGLGQNVFRWTISVGSCTPSVSEVTITRSTPPATPVATANSPLCAGQTLELSASPVNGAVYIWSGPQNYQAAGQNQLLQNVGTANSGTYSVVAYANSCASEPGTVSVTVNSAGTGPVASYNNPVCAGQDLQLAASTVPGATSYSWVGPEGFSSTDQNPILANADASMAGTYSVYALGSACASVPGLVTVSIGQVPAVPTILASSSTALCQGQSVNLTAAATGPYTWSTGQNTQVITVNTADDYSVTVANGCGSTASQPVTVTVTPLPVVSAVATNANICSNQSTTLTASGASSYFWSPNGSLSAATGAVVTASPGTSTIYTVTGSANGCSATATVQVNVTPAPVVSATASQTTITSGQSTMLTASGATTYSWSPAAGISNPTAAIVEVTPANTTIYTLTGTTGDCSAQAYITITVNPATYTLTATSGANGSISPSGTVQVTSGDDQTFAITPDCGYQVENVQVNGSWVGAVNSYTFSNVSGNGTIHATFSAVNPLIWASGTTALCPGQTVNLTVTAATAYSWSNGETTQFITVDAAGEYSAQIITAPGCTLSAAPVTVTALPAPSATIVPLGPTTICQGQSVELSATGTGSFTWSTGQTGNLLVVNSANDYTLTAVNQCGSAVSDPVVVTVNPQPSVTVTTSGSTNICQGQTVSLSASGTGIFTWSNGETTPVITVDQAGVYYVTATNNCGTVQSGNTFVNVISPPTATITPGGPTTFCQGQNVVLSASGGASYSWSTGATTQNITVSQSGTYTVTATNQCGNAVSDPVTVSVTTTPVVEIIPDGSLSFCLGGNVTLSASTGSSYTWSSGQNTQTITVDATGNYTVTVTTSCGSATSAPVVVSVLEAPTVAILASTQQPVCEGQPVSLTAQQANNFAVNLNGGNQFVAFTDVLDFGTGDFTVEAWFNADVFPTSAEGSKLINKGLTAAGSPANAGYGFRLIRESNVNKIRFMLIGSSSTTVDATGLSTNTWYHVAAVRQGTSISIYLNGVLAGTASTGTVQNVNTNIPLAFGALYRGAFGPTSEYYDGRIDEVRFWNTARSASEISAAINGVPENSTGLAAYWNLNAGTGTTVASSVPGPAVNGTIQNSATWVPGAPATGSSLPVTYAWAPAAGLSAVSGQFVTATPGSTTSYSVTATNSCGSTTSAAHTVAITPAPTATITPGGPTTFCQGQNVVLSGSGGSSYSWSTGATTQNITVSASGVYTVAAINACGTVLSDPVTVTVTTSPVASVTAGGATSFCEGGSVNLTASAGSAYSWNTGANSQVITADQDGLYTVWVTTGCGTANASQVVTVNPSPVAAIAPGGSLQICPPASVNLQASGSALQFDGVNDYVSNPNSFAGVTGNFTMEFWVNPTATRNSTAEVTSGANGVGGQRYAIYPDWGTSYGSSHAGAGVSVGANGISVFEHADFYLPSLLVYNTSLIGWTHVAVVYNNNKPSLYVNGVLVRTGLQSTRIVHPSASLSAITPSYGPYAGFLDEVRIWSVARTQAQIQDAMYRSVSPNAAGLVTYFPLNNGQGTSAANAVSGALAGNLTNGPVWTLNTAPINTTTTYAWSPAAGLSSTTGSLVSASPATTTAYTVTASNSCGTTTSAPLEVVTTSPATLAVTASETTICGGSSAFLTATGATTYTWSPAAGLSATTGSIVSASPQSSTVYTVTGSNGSCSSTATIALNVSSQVAVWVSASAGTICPGQSATLTANGAANYTWSPAAGLSATTGAMVEASPTVATTYTVTGTSGNCSNTAYFALGVNNQPTASITVQGSATVCEGQTVFLTASSGTGYTWSNGANSQIIGVTADGTYTVTVANACGTAVSDPVTVTFNPVPAVPTVTAQGSTSICQGGTVTLSASAADSYLWSNGATTQTISVSGAGNYSVTVFTNDGCSAQSAPVSVTVTSPLADFLADNPYKVLPNGTVSFTASTVGTIASYAWDFGDGNSSSDPAPSHTYTNPGFYTVSLTVTDNTGCSATLTKPTYISVWPLFTSVPLSTGTTQPIPGVSFIGPYAGCVAVYGGSSFGGGYVLTTNDGGQTWGTSNIGVSNNLTNIYLVGNLGFISGTNGLLCVSNNGGASWTPFTTGTSETFYGLNFTSTTSGWAVGSGGTICYYNGSTWVPYFTGVSNTFYNVYAYGGNAWAVGSGGILCYYNGSTWVPQTSGVTGNLNGVYFVNGSTGYAVGAGGTILYTSNGGATWTTQTSGVPYNLTAIAFGSGASSNIGVCVGDNGTVLYTTDGGLTWNIYSIGTPVNLTGCTVVGCEGYITGENGAAFSFQIGTPPAQPVVTATGPTNICSGGSVTLSASPAPNYLWSTGATTQTITVSQSGSYSVAASSACSTAVSVPVPVTINNSLSDFSASAVNLYLPNGTTNFSATTDGSVVDYLWDFGDGNTSTDPAPAHTYSTKGFYTVSLTVTDNTGCTATLTKPNYVLVWDVFPATPLVTGTNQPIPGVSFNGPYSGCVAVYNGYGQGGGTVLQTVNGGQSWSQVPVGVPNFLTNIFLIGNQAFISGTGGLLCVSNSSGTGWIPFATGTSETFYGLSFTSTSNGWAVGSGGIICRYDGSDWLPYPTGVSHTFYSVYSYGNFAWAVGSNGIICYYNGSTWVPQTSGTSVNLYGVYFLNALQGWVVGEGGLILYTSNGGTTWTTQSSGLPWTLNACAFSPNGRGVAVGNNGVVCYTTNFGQTWELYSIGSSVDLTACTVNGCEAYITGDNGEAFNFQIGTPPAAPTVTSSGATAICSGAPVTLSASAADTYTWSNGETTQTITVTDPGSYTVTITQANTCSTAVSVPFVLNAAPAITVAATANPATIPVGQAASLEVSAPDNSYTYSWTGPNLGSSSGSTVIAAPTVAGTYTYTVEASNGSCTASTTVLLTVQTSTVPCTTALNGTYTVNPAQITIGNNFQSIAAMVTALETIGVCGPVVVNFAPGTYSAIYVQGQIPGSSSTNTVTLNGGGVAAIESCAGYGSSMITLDGTDNVVIEGFTLNAPCMYGRGIWLKNSTENITIHNNQIQIPLYTSVANAGILAQDPGALTIEGNTINGGRRGIQIENATGSITIGNANPGVLPTDQLGNRILNAYEYGLGIFNASNVLVSHNTINMRSGNSNTAVHGRDLIGFSFESNLIVGAGRVGISLNSSSGGSLINNRIGQFQAGSAQVTAVYMANTTGVNVYHNSLWANAGSQYSYGLRMISGTSGMDVQNNIFMSSSSTGAALYGGAGAFSTLSHNNYFNTAGGSIAFLNKWYSQLAAFPAMFSTAGSFAVDPLFSTGSTFTDAMRTGNIALADVISASASLVPVDFEDEPRPMGVGVSLGADEFGGVSRFVASTPLETVVYPNPFHNQLTVRLTDTQAGDVQVVLTDLMGRQIISQQFGVEAGATSLSLPVEENIAQGVYLLQVRQGEATATFRVVKH